jgi:hypothetical protein
MGSVSRVFKKVKRAVTKPISKAFKGVVKGIMKVGKATMRGVAKLNQKLGPLGSIAMAIAMPYALSGLSSLTNAAMASTPGTFLHSIGQVGNSIRTGYQAFNAGISKGFSTITKSISKGFQRFTPQGVKNMFSNISTGAKNLYNSAKATMKKYTPKPFTAKEGTVEFFGAADPGVGTMTSSEAAAAIQKGTLSASELGTQTLTKPSGWFTKTNVVGVESDKIITDTINNAYQNRLKGFGKNATTMFNDIKTRAIELNTYVNDEQIGSFVENNIGTKQYSKEVLSYSGDMDYYGTGTGKYDIKTEIADLSKTGDYIDNGQGGYRFTGDKTFAKDPTVKKFDTKKLASTISKSLLKPSAPETIKPYYMGQQDMTMQTGLTGYTGTDIQGSGGGSLLKGVFSDEEQQRIMTYYKNMNLIGSS